MIKIPEVSPKVPGLLPGKRIVAVVYSNYPADPRPRRAAEALASEGAKVEVICLKGADSELRSEVFNGVAVTRIPIKHRRGGKLTYIFQYCLFIAWAGAILARRTLRGSVQLVHVHNMPDILVFSALVPKLFGAKIILDLHDPMPELMESIFSLPEESNAVRFLKICEKLSMRFAHAVLTVNKTFSELFAQRSCRREKITVVMNSPDEAIFSFRQVSPPDSTQTAAEKPFVIMYHGSIVERHGLDLAVQALGHIRKSIPQAELRIFGRSTPFLDQVLASARASGLGEAVRYMGPQKLEGIVAAMGDCDVGVIPNQKSRFTEINTPTRIFEFLSQGKPVIAPRAQGILDYFSPDELFFFELGDAQDLAAKLEYVFCHPNETVKSVARGQEVYLNHLWSIERRRYLGLVETVLRPPEKSEIRVQRSALSLLNSRK